MLNSEQGRLYRGGELVEIEPKIFKVLEYMLDHSGELISHDELLEKCWPGRYISEGTLTRSLSRVRRVIGHSAKNKLIETIHTKGYRFVGTVEKSAETPADDQPLADADDLAAEAVVTATDVSSESSATPVQMQSPPLQPPTISQLEIEPPEPVNKTPGNNHSLALSTGAERRQLTVMSCLLSELIGDIESDDELDVEDLYQLKQDFRQLFVECVTPFDGYIAQQLADSIVVYFGYPQAREDNARRAVLAALQLIERLQQAAPDPIASMQVRIGIHTGLVVIETPARGETQTPLMSGPTQTVSMQLCQQAGLQSVLVSDATLRLTKNYFEWQVLTDQKIACYQISGISQFSQTLQSDSPQTRQGITPFVGREAELAMLNDSWERTSEGMGQIVLLSGDAGIGKSRLVERLKQQVLEQSHLCLECRCSPYHQNTAFFPVIDLLQRILQQYPVAAIAGESELSRLEALIQHSQLPPDDAVPLLAELMSLSVPSGRYPGVDGNPQQQREQMLNILLTLLLSQAEAQPLLLIVEDLHWADPSTLELIELLIDQAPVMSVMAVLTCRPEFESSWTRHASVTSLLLNRFSRQHIEQMLWRITQGKALPEEISRQISENTDGVPLFIEELVRTLLESEQLREAGDRFELNAAKARPAIPATLQDSLMARLDRLGEAKEIARWGAVIGREFSYKLLASVVPLDELALQQGLEQLLASGLIFRRGLPPDVHYLFKHVLVQEAAYQSLLKRQRQSIHLHIAGALEKEPFATANNEPELLALHYQQAQQQAQAVYYWQVAGNRALSRSAMQEALHHFNNALALLKKSSKRAQPDESQLRQELKLQTTIGSILVALKGQAAREVEMTYRRADELCQQLGETEQRFPILWGLWRLHLNRAEVNAAGDLAQQLLDLAQRHTNNSLKLVAHLACTNTDLTLGKFASAYEHIQQGLALSNHEQHRDLVITYGGWEPDAYCLALAGQAQWTLGYPEQATKSCLQALALVRELAQPYALVSALNYVIMQYVRRRELDQVKTLAEELIELSKQHNFSARLPIGKMYLGWALTLQGDCDNGLQQMREGVDAYAETGALLALPIWHLLLADAYLHCGHYQDADQLLIESLAISVKTGERQLLADLHRLKGECLRQQSNAQEAETYFQQALAIAREQQAKSLELRAATSLARLWQEQNNAKAAHQLLSDVYDWFSEGFATADLQEAKSLLQQLA